VHKEKIHRIELKRKFIESSLPVWIYYISYIGSEEEKKK